MAAKPVPPEELQRTLDALVAAGGNQSVAARVLGISRATVQSRAEAMKRAGGDVPDATGGFVTATPGVREPLTSFEEAWSQWQRFIGMARDRYVQPSREFVINERKKILVVPDVHAPFHEPEMFAAMLEDEKDADVVVCIGDISDAYALSTFVKYERMSFSDEWAAVTLVMQELASRFPKVIVVIGNHDGRLEKRIRERLSEDAVDAIKYMTGGTLCPVTALTKRYPNVEIAHHVTPSGHAVDWFTTLGDAWFGHPEKFSRTPGAALRGVEEWIVDNEVALGMDAYRLIIMGHTHAASILPWRANKLLVECGCLAKQQGYMLSPRVGGRPQRRGYVTFTQTDGVSDLNSLRFRWLDVEAVA